MRSSTTRIDPAAEPAAEPAADVAVELTDADILAVLRQAAVLHNHVAAVLRTTGLSVDRWRCLAFVANQPDASMSEVLHGLAMAAATASRAVDALVDANLLMRTIDPADRRRVLLRISTDGTLLLRRVQMRLAVGEVGS
ncbi:MarR family winged helix-turn-helix transcriptional regulator [Kineococcus sp. SYSU DK006]|uniref:MarR family winged helix-turn-helix transcriptional regulator n=1 Tax=Kineococcus sp. SYSU DK006 TaxID=3383127 RepID=UPI003D7C821F